MVFSQLSGASGLFLDPTFVYVQALGVFSLEITEWAMCCWKHWGRDWKPINIYVDSYWSTAFACVALLRFQRGMPPSIKKLFFINK
jgi:hypothetical protein